MVIKLKLKQTAFKAGFLIAATVGAAFLVKIILDEYVIFALADVRFRVDRGILVSANDFRPNSPRLLARLAESEIRGPDPNRESAEKYAKQAIYWSPNDFNYRLLLGEIREALGDKQGANDAYGDALQIAPNDHMAHWRMANLLTREGQIDPAIDHFHFVTKFNPAVLPATLDLIWVASGQNVSALSRIVEGNSKAELKLAVFFASHSRPSDAVAGFSKVDPVIVLSSTDTPRLLDALINNGFPKLALDVWRRIGLTGEQSDSRSEIWNGDFEIAPARGLTQFDWRLEKSDYAKASVDTRNAHSGSHSLLIDFTGRDTTRMDKEIQHLIVVRPGVSYQIKFFIRTEKFYSPADGPSLVVTTFNGDVVGKSKPIAQESSDWQQMSIDFSLPKGQDDWVPVFISVKRQPKFSYDEPTRGRVWLDDFSLIEVGRK